MPRILSVLVVLVLLGGVYLLPEADPDELAVQEAAMLVAQEPPSPARAPEVEVEVVAPAREPAEVALERGPEAPPPATPAEALLASRAFEATAYVPDDDGVETQVPSAGRLRLYGVRYETRFEGQIDPDEMDARQEDLALQIHDRLRQSIVRGLRTWAGGEKIDLEIVGEEFPASGGASFLLLGGPEQLELRLDLPGRERHTFLYEWRPPRRSSLWPPLVAIALALALRRPVIALFFGVLAAAVLLRLDAGAGPFTTVFGGLYDVLDVFFREELQRKDRLQIVGFVVAMLAMVGVVTRNGGLRGVMDHVARLAKSARRTQIATWLMGLLVFFDDYANTILVGSTMRPLADRFRVAREKLAYVVDSTAAPVAGISIFSTWIAFEVSTFSSQLPAAGLSPDRGYEVFIQTLPYRFYCILTLFFVGLVVVSGRDFGPMLKAERRARLEGKLVRDGAKPMVGDLATQMQTAEGVTPRAYRAVVPLLVFVGGTIYWMIRTGWAGSGGSEAFTERGPVLGISALLGASDSIEALLYGSSAGFLLAVVLSLLAGMRGEIARAALTTLRSMGIALVILYLAWMLAAACGSLGTGEYLTVGLRDVLMPALLPMMLFALAGAVAFSTGSSWGTMSILLPLVVGLSYGLGAGLAIGGIGLMVISIGAVLEGSIFGDHCSPISDTTVLSSTATASDHIDHVRTQIPYALLTMIVAMVAGYLPSTVMGWSPFAGLGVGALVLVAALWLLGERVVPRGPRAAEIAGAGGEVEALAGEPPVSSGAGSGRAPR